MLYSLSTKYAVIALVELAAHKVTPPVLVKEIATSKGIPQSFLAKLVPLLVKAGILTSTRGKNGGIQFARPPAKISIADVVRTIEGGTYFQDCLFEISPCDGWRNCSLHKVWGPLRDQIVNFLENTTIQDVADNAPERTNRGGSR